MNKKIFAIIADGFEEIELIGVVDVLRRLNVEVNLAALGKEIKVTGAHGITIEADCFLDEVGFEAYDGVFLPGGMPGSLNLYNSDAVRDILLAMDDCGQLIIAICAAPMVLSKAGLLKDEKFTMYPDMDEYLNGEEYTSDFVEISGNIVTGKGPGAVFHVAAAIASCLGLAAQLKELYKGMFIELHD